MYAGDREVSPAATLDMVLTTIIGQCVVDRRYDRAKDQLKCALDCDAGQSYSDKCGGSGNGDNAHKR